MRADPAPPGLPTAAPPPGPRRGARAFGFGLRTRPRPFPRRRAHALAAALLAVLAALLVAGGLRDSPTVDEPNHLVRGLAWWRAGDTRLSVAHPPLANLLQAAPGAALGIGRDLDTRTGWDRADASPVAIAFFREDYESARRALYLGRLVTAAIALLFGAYLYGLALAGGRRRALAGGRRRALAVLALYAFHPVVLAHGHLVTTDLPVAAALAVAAGETWRFLRTGRRLRLATLSLALGAALATKYSAVLFVPPLLAAAGWAAVRGEGPYRTRPSRRLSRLAGHVAVAAAVAALCVGASYRFERTGWTLGRLLDEPEPALWSTRGHPGRTLERLPLLAALPRGLPVPLPYSWTFGIAGVKAQDARGHGGWFWGHAGRGPWYYFPLLLVVKSPAAHLALLALALLLAARRRPRLRGATLALALPPATFLAVSLGSGIQLGVRHVLPVLPGLLLAAGGAVAWLAHRARGAARLAAPALLALAAAEALAACPRFLGHFSWAIGGRAVGHRISLIGEDWGQDVGELARVARDEGLAPLYYRPYGPAAWPELRRNGVAARRFACGDRIPGPAWLAVHAASAVRLREPCDPVGRRPPDRVLADHVYLYRIEPPTPASPDPGSSWAGIRR